MKRMIVKKKTMLLLLLILFAGSLLCFGCAPDTEQPKEDDAEKYNDVYIVSDSSRTTNDWDMRYGAIKADGTMVLPMEYSRIQLLEDLATGEPLWLQTYELDLKEGVDDTELTDDMLRDYYEGSYTGEESKYFNHQYKLYDLDGNLGKELGSNGLQYICGDLERYNDQTLVNRKTGEVLFTDAAAITWAEDCYIVTYDQYRRVCVMDSDLNVLFDREGSEGFTAANGDYYVTTRENGKSGLCRLDGTQAVPNEYDYIINYYSYAPYVQAQQGDTKLVISLEDGHIVYQNSDEADYIQELFPDFMIIQDREDVVDTELYPSYRYYTQFYDYNGKPVSDKYLSLSPQNDYYQRTRDETGEGVLIFSVTDKEGRKYLMNEDEEEIFALSENQWASILSEDCIVVNDVDSGIMCRLDGTVLTERAYDSINQLYLKAKTGYHSSSKLATGNYRHNHVWLQDVLDADGNIILERLKSVTMLSEDLFWVEKGFSQGLMDIDGNWLYEQSLFDGAADE